MKILRRVKLGLAFSSVLAVALVSFGTAKHAQAATTGYSQNQIKAAQVWVDSSSHATHIYLKFKDGSKADMYGTGKPSVSYNNGKGPVYIYSDSAYSRSFCNPVNSYQGSTLSQIALTFTLIDSSGNFFPGASGKVTDYSEGALNGLGQTVDYFFTGKGANDPGQDKTDCVVNYGKYGLIPNDPTVHGISTTPSGLDNVTKNIGAITFKDGYNISLNYKDANGNNKIYNYYDKDPFDKSYNFADQDHPFCSVCPNSQCPSENGINLKIKSADALSNSPIKANLDVTYLDQNHQCQVQTVTEDVTNDNAAATQVLTWDGSDIKNLNQGDVNIDTKQSPKDNTVYQQVLSSDSSSDGCGGSESNNWVVALQNNGTTNGTLYYLDGNTDPKNPGVHINNLLFASCWLKPTGKYTAKRDVSIAGTKGVSLGNPGDPSSGDNSNCVGQNSSSGLEWLLCPITTSLEKAADSLDGQIEAQLHFDTKDSLPDDGSVHLTWAIIKNISSGLIVVLLLIMVIAQAMGGGPFEAYTVRKMLPKLVAAVILMQISWPLCVWLIGLANDFGKGIGQLLSLPFGGGGSLELNNILANAHWSTVANTALPVALLVTGIAVAVDLPATMVVVFGLLVGLVAAFMVLLFRNVMIMALVIFSPLAFLASTMSGTDKLWKQWKDNFMKLLAMFPLIIAMVYVGRVFAWILAQQTKDPGLLNFMGVMVAYFGPYFMIFKAYKWGGSAMAAAGEGINKGINKAAERPRKLLESRAEQHKEGKPIAAADRLSRWQTLNRRQKLGSMLRGDKLRSGEWDPTMRTSKILRHERQVKTAKFKAAGPKHNEELIEAETGAFQGYLRSSVDRSSHDDVRKAGMAGKDLIYTPGDETSGILLANGKRGSYYGSKLTSAQRQAVLDRGVVHGHMRSVEEYLDKAMKGSPEERAAAVAFLDRNAQTLGKEMPHLLKGLTIAARSKPDAIAGMRQEAIESTIAKLQEKMNDTSPGVSDADRQAAAENLSIFLQNYAAAAADPRLSSQLDPGGAKVVKAAVDSLGPQLQEINIDDKDARVTTYHLAPVQDLDSSIPPTYKAIFDDPAVKAALGQISTLVTTEGIINTKAVPAPSGNIQVAASPTEIKIQHTQTAKAILPPPATISVAGPDLDAFKLQIGSDPAVRQVLAQNIAYGTVDSPQYKQTLEEYRNGLMSIYTDPASTPEQAEKARSQWNAMADEIQQATRRRIDETAAAAAARGHDVVSARTAAGARLNPQIIGYESTAPTPPAGEPDLRKF